MTKTIEEQSKLVNVAKALTKDDNECLELMLSCNNGDFDSLATHVDDVVEAFVEINQKLYGHDDTEICLDCLTECKTHYYNEGFKEFADVDVDNFIDAIYFVYDVAFNDNPISVVTKLAEEVFGDKFIDVCHSTVDFTKAEPVDDLEELIDVDALNEYLGVFVQDDDMYDRFREAFKDDLVGLQLMVNGYLNKLLDLHMYVYEYNFKHFTTINLNYISMSKENFFDNRHKTLLKHTDFMGAIDILDEFSKKSIMDRDKIVELCEDLFEDEFLYITDYDVLNN